MNFKEYIEAHRSGVYSTICSYIPIREPVQHYTMVRDYVDRQGSYRRPGLLMLAGQVFGADPNELLLPAAAMQLSEDWILIHDDVEDHSEMRRGKPALQRIYGDELAINAGDAAHIAMWKMLHDYAGKAGMEKGRKVYDKFYDILEHTVEGQYRECNFIYNVRKLRDANEDFYFKIAGSKTCYYTVYGPMQLGALAAGQGMEVLDGLEAIGKPAGIAFQIVDDILDMTADEKTFGKKRYGDIYEGKATLISIHAYEQASTAEREKLDSIYTKSRKEKTKEDVDYVIDLIEKYDGIGYAMGIAESMGDETKKAVEKHLPEFPSSIYTNIILTAMEELYIRKG